MGPIIVEQQSSSRCEYRPRPRVVVPALNPLLHLLGYVVVTHVRLGAVLQATSQTASSKTSSQSGRRAAAALSAAATFILRLMTDRKR